MTTTAAVATQPSHARVTSIDAHPAVVRAKAQRAKLEAGLSVARERQQQLIVDRPELAAQVQNQAMARLTGDGAAGDDLRPQLVAHDAEIDRLQADIEMLTHQLQVQAGHDRAALSEAQNEMRLQIQGNAKELMEQQAAVLAQLEPLTVELLRLHRFGLVKLPETAFVFSAELIAAHRRAARAFGCDV
jgi:chromosome segregation ATPase